MNRSTDGQWLRMKTALGFPPVVEAWNSLEFPILTILTERSMVNSGSKNNFTRLDKSEYLLQARDFSSIMTFSLGLEAMSQLQSWPTTTAVYGCNESELPSDNPSILRAAKLQLIRSNFGRLFSIDGAILKPWPGPVTLSTGLGIHHDNLGPTSMSPLIPGTFQ